TQVKRGNHYDASMCAAQTRTVNAFGEGGRFATRAIPRLFERYVVYNPFPELARASVRFLSPGETIAPPPLQDVRIPAATAVLINPEEQFEPMLDLSAVIRVWQGRAVVAARLITDEQISWGLASPLITDGVLPRGLTQNGETKVVVLNPTDTSPHLTAAGFADESTIPQQAFDIDPNTRTSFVINS